MRQQQVSGDRYRWRSTLEPEQAQEAVELVLQQAEVLSSAWCN
ncbi:MAG: hypothetical protein RLN85_14605 [Pseudomonadales bacterium]